MTPTDALVAALVVTSVAFSLVALVGFARLPDAFARAHAASKSETLGALAGLAAAAVAFGPGSEAIKVGLLSLFLLVTGPTAAHAVVRGAYRSGVEPWTPTTAEEEP
ncbi:MAG: monovalent cation/H(+) antiporter subunit G [Haloferacaceae archaeon]